MQRISPRTLALLLLTSLPASAQSTLDEYFGSLANSQAGYSTTGGVDFNQDGWDDVVVGSPFADGATLLTSTGRVDAYSGRDGSPLWTKFGLASNDYFGCDVALAGDVDGDGIQDIIAGAYNGRDPFTGLRAGFAKVYSGATGALLHAVYGDNNGDQFGWSVGGGLDHDGDGLSEFVVGAPNADSGGFGNRRGASRVFDGATGNIVRTHTSIYNDARWGQSIWAQTDIDGDGTIDILVGVPGAGSNDEGQIRAIDGSSLNSLLGWNMIGINAGGRLGACVTAGIDVDGDGRPEVFAGTPLDDTNGAGAGFVGMYSGQDGTLLDTWFGSALDQAFGSSVAIIGDVDGDGERDFAVGATEFLTGPGFVTVYSSDTKAEVFTVAGRQVGDLFGADVARGGDVNADGKPDLLVGGPSVNEQSGMTVGSVRVLSAAGPGIVTYCTPGTSSTGCQAQITAAGIPSASAPSGFLLQANTVEGGKNGIFFYGANGRQANAWGNGSSFQCVTPPVKRGALLSGGGASGSCAGFFSMDLNARWCPTCPKPTHNYGAGAVVQAQLWYRDPLNTSNQTTGLSNAVEFVVQP